MAKREMPPARVQHRALLENQKAGVYTTGDPEGKLNVFREYQKYGYFPPDFNDPIEMQSAVRALIAEGIPKKEAMAALGIQYDVFDSKGRITGRIFRDSMSPGLADAIDTRVGAGKANELAKAEKKFWNAAVAENRDIAPRLGMAVNEGHIDTSAGGAPGSNRAAGLESAVLNQINGRSAANPSRPVSDWERSNIGVANTQIAGKYEAGLQLDGIPARSGTERLLNPHVSGLLGSDAATRYIPPEELETFNRTFDDLQAQKYSPEAMYDHIKAGGSTDPRALAAAGLEQRNVSTFAETPKNAAPVYTTQVDPRFLGSVNVAAPTRSVTQPNKRATPVKTPKRIPGLDIKGGLGGAALGAGLAYLMGDNASQAAAGNIPIVSDIESTNTGVAERAGTNIFVDPKTNRLMPTNRSQVGMGLAYLNGKPVAVPYGSVAGTKSNGQILKEAGQQIVDVNRDRLQRAAQSVVGHFQPKPLPTTSKPRIKPILTGKLSAAQIRTFQAGGGQAAMLRDGLTREQVIERGSALLLKQKYG